MNNTVSLSSLEPRARSPHLQVALAHARERLLAGADDGAVADLIEMLDVCDSSLTPDLVAEVASICRANPLHQLLLEDPYTARAFSKPRGYAGDAVMLDYLYQQRAPRGTSHVGQAVFRATTGCATARSVVARRDLLADRIDTVAAERARPNILAIACGHLREAARASAVGERRLGKFVALDQDAESLAVVEHEHGALGISTVQESVGGLLKGRVQFRDLDLVYAAGLLDYLDDNVARRLLDVMFAATRPGGRILVANFTPYHQARGYMTHFMDWTLVRRGEPDLARLAAHLAPGVFSTRTFTDAAGNIAYLELVKG